MKLIYAISFWICLGAIFGQNNRIIGGRPAKIGEFPYQVSLSIRNEHVCGGVILSPRFVLSAAHCFKIGDVSFPLSHYNVTAGQLAHQITKSSVYRGILRLIIHEDYRSFGYYYAINDIALAELQKELPSDNNLISPVQLNTKTVNYRLCTVTGWGTTLRDDSVLSDNLMVAEVHIVDFDVCQRRYNRTKSRVGPGMVCAGHPEGASDACEGDSGGPLVCNGLQVGIVSWSGICATVQDPVVYTDVAHYVSWIENQTAITFT